MNSIAIIPARGGSKRIPLKNIREFCGKPIIAYSIEAALSSNLFDKVMVSTDSPEIAAVSVEYGAEVPFFRSEKNSNDFATTSDVLEEVVDQYNLYGVYFNTICCIYPTAPFVSPSLLKKAMELYIRKKASCVVPIVKYSFPPQRAFIIEGENVYFQYPEYSKTRSQDLKPLYHDCGQFYILRVDSLLEYHSIVPPNTFPVILSENEVQDIDTLSDWKVAETKYMAFKQVNN